MKKYIKITKCFRDQEMERCVFVFYLNEESFFNKDAIEHVDSNIKYSYYNLLKSAEVVLRNDEIVKCRQSISNEDIFDKLMGLTSKYF